MHAYIGADAAQQDKGLTECHVPISRHLQGHQHQPMAPLLEMRNYKVRLRLFRSRCVEINEPKWAKLWQGLGPA